MKKIIYGLLVVVMLFGVAAVTFAKTKSNSMAAMGDSISQATNAGFLFIGDHPERSWATGDMRDIVFSHFERIKSQFRKLSIKNAYNNAESGARVQDLLMPGGQLDKTITQEPKYITVMIGSNDSCFATNPATFKTNYENLVVELTQELPDAKILLVSLPDIARLKTILGDRAYCNFVWNRFGLCPTLFTPGADAAVFNATVTTMNGIIETIANEAGENVSFADVYDYKFQPYQISNLDCFHPSLFGQAELASWTWQSDLLAQ